MVGKLGIIFPLIIAIFLFLNCRYKKPNLASSPAEFYDNEAYDILQKTTYNALSDSLSSKALELINKAITSTS